MDPGAIGNAQWSEISSLLINLWLVVLSVVLMATNVIIGVNSIPSLMATGHIPESLGKTRPLFWVFSLAFFGAAIFFLVRVIDHADVLRDFWAHYWI